MSRTEALEIITLPEPYTDESSIENIHVGIDALLANEIPAFQVDVGREHHMAGTFAVQAVVEARVNELIGDVHAAHEYLPFAFTGQNLRVPHAKPENSGLMRFPPHEDSDQIGIAMHKPYAGEPTRTQFGFRKPGVALPEISPEPYEGSDLHPFVETVYEGTAQLGRLTLFSQGHPLIDMKPAAHFFERNTEQKVGGRYTRYYMLDPAIYSFAAITDYPAFVEMRRQTATYLDYQQWRILDENLQQHGEMLSPERFQEWRNLANEQLQGHPGAEYVYMDGDGRTTYGVHRIGDVPLDLEAFQIRKHHTINESS